MASDSAKEQFNQQLEQILESLRQTASKAEKRRQNEKLKRDQLNDKYLELMEKQRLYHKLVKEFQQVYFRTFCDEAFGVIGSLWSSVPLELLRFTWCMHICGHLMVETPVLGPHSTFLSSLIHQTKVGNTLFPFFLFARISFNFYRIFSLDRSGCRKYPKLHYSALNVIALFK